MIYLGAYRVDRNDHARLIQTARALLFSGVGVRRERMLEGWEGLCVLTLRGGHHVHVLAGPVDGMVEFWVTSPSVELVDG